MRHYLLLILLWSATGFADPFYDSEMPAEQAVESTQNMATNPEKTTACLPPEQAEKSLINQPFAKLKLIGIVKFNDQFKALFINEEQQLIDLKINDILEPDLIQIEHIDLKSVRYIQWQKTTQCDNPVKSLMKL